MQRRTRIWVGLGTALLVGSTGVERVALARETPVLSPSARQPADAPAEPRIYVAQAEAAGEGGPNEGGGPVIGTITEFRLSSSAGDAAFNQDASAQVDAYVNLVAATYDGALDAATALHDAVAALAESPSPAALERARGSWTAARNAYLASEAFLFYAGPIDGPGGPFARLKSWPVDPVVIDGLIADASQSLNFRTLAQLNRTEPPVAITTGLHVLEYLLWGVDGDVTAESFAAEPRRGAYAAALARLLTNDLTVVAAAWAPGSNNYRASVEAMDQRNALGRAFNGMAVLLGYEIPLRRIGAGLFPANQNFQPSPFSRTSADDYLHAFLGAKSVYEDGLINALLETVDPELEGKIASGFETAEAAVRAMDAPFERFLAPPAGSPERAVAEAAVKALTNLARDLRTAGNRLGILVVVPGM